MPIGSSSASAVILQATARPSATPVAASRPRQPARPCAIRTAPSSAAAVKVVRNVSTAQKCESWMPRTQNADRPPRRGRRGGG